MALVSGLVGVGAAVFCLLSVYYLFAVCSFSVCCLSAVCLLSVCCLLLVVSCLSVMLFAFVICFAICSLFVLPLSVHFHFAVCSFSVYCLSIVCLLFACCMPAALGRKIKYRFPAWQALEVFSERQPLIFSHYLCLCGSFFSSRSYIVYVRSRQYSYFRLPVTFSFWYVESLHSFGRGCQIPAFPDSFGRSHRAFSGSVSLVGIVKPFSL